ncbi:thiamine diphosphokinase [Mariniplasma anaerobium]|uniref:Thiamine diphosphokinase n=1 Tax=Mariniplasma anaerobium TaxID=2735436 RepID=A0A7U9XUT2_9MOLU|nr:thiamine diphosphokinase [Mariniplasma anaerobium]BCR36412.1 thiamine pyrophosphokinase [Mariniplasma anaerobium]
MRVLIVVHPVPKDIKKIISLKDDDYIIAVDQAVLSLYKQRIPINLAIGDFDSLNHHGILNTLNVLKLDPIKDVTDSYQALIEAQKLNPDEYIMVGGIGGNRVEHFMAHILLFNKFPKLKIINDKSEIFMLENQDYIVDFKGYVSIFAYDNALITLKGFKYPLETYELKRYDPLGISNEIINDSGHICVKEGKVLVVLSSRDR